MPFAARLQELRSDREHGASWMARRAVETLVEVSEEEVGSAYAFLDRLLSAGRELAGSRPGVGAVEAAVGRLLASVHSTAHLELPELRRLFQEEAEALLDSRRRAAASIAIQLSPELTDVLVLTHSASATVREALLHTPPERVFCTVSEPAGEGRAFARELGEAGIEVELVEDADARETLRHASLFLVGADTVFRDGTLCNKAGTHALAQAAADEGVRMIVASEVIKLAPIAAADAPALTGPGRAHFDFTPPHLIDEIVTEEGVFEIDELPALVDRTPFLREGYALLLGSS